MARIHVLIVLAVVAAAAVGCGTTEKTGSVGDTLDARTVHVTLHKWVPRTGGINIEVCRDEPGQAINAYAFLLERDGDTLQPTRPYTHYDDEFDANREGCERGWIEYPLPAAKAAKTLKFSYDDTGSASPGDRREEHIDFTWNL